MEEIAKEYDVIVLGTGEFCPVHLVTPSSNYRPTPRTAKETSPPRPMVAACATTTITAEGNQTHNMDLKIKRVYLLSRFFI